MPSMMPQVDFHHIAHLTPSKDTTHWYSVKSHPEHDEWTSIRLVVSHKHPVVALDHSMHVTNVRCSENTIVTADFVTPEAYDHARAMWSQEEDVVVVTAAPSCSNDGQNAFYHVTGMKFDKDRHSVALRCNWRHIYDVAEDYTIDFGKMNYDQTNKSAPSPSVPCDEEPKVSTRTATATHHPKEGHKGEVMGFLAVHPGPDFDQRFDDKLGYYSQENISGNVRMLTSRETTT